MSLINVINQLRRLPVLNGQVAAGAIEDLSNYQFATLPAAYVIPLVDEASQNESMTHLKQWVTQHIGIVVVFSNAAGVTSTNDRRGQGVAEQYDLVKFSIFKAILNWNPYSVVENPDETDLTDPIIGHAIKGFYYTGCSQVAAGLSRLAYEFRFAIEFQIDDTDGWEATGVPLEEIFITYTDPDTGDVLATEDITGLQDVPVGMTGVQARASVGTFTVMKS